MNVKTEITVSGGWGGYSDHKIPETAFLSDAQSVILQFVGANYCLFTNTNTNGTIREFKWNDANQMGVTLILTGDLLQAAKNGYLALKPNGGSNYKLYVSNFASETPIREQLTDIPTIYLTVPAAINKNIDDVLYKDRSTNYAPYYQATIQVVDNTGDLEQFTDSKLEIKVRGNSTANSSTKRPYRLKFGKDDKDPITGEVITSHKHDLLGYGYKKRNWVLMANAFDGSMVRNALSYRVGQLVGMDFCPGWKFVDLVINEEYRGTYMVSDHIEVGSHRIDIDEDTGWYIEANGQPIMAEEPYTTGGGLTLSIKNPEPETNAETTALKTEVSDFFTAMSSKFTATNFSDPVSGWRSMADEESLIKFWIGTNISANYDGFMTVKMFRDVDDPRVHFGPLWDHDLAWGNYSKENLGHRIEEYDNGNFNQIMRKAWTDPLFVKKAYEKWYELINAGLKKDLLDYVDMLHKTIEQSEVLNHKKWTTYMAGFEDSGLKTHDATIEFLKDFVDKHIDGIQAQLDAQYIALGCANIEDPTTPDETPVGDLGALVDLGNGKYSYTGSASTFKEGTVITITTSNGATLSNYITEGSTWNNANKITLNATDVSALAANKYTFYMNANGGEILAVNVKVPNETGTLKYVGKNTYWGYGEEQYTYVGSKSSFKEGNTITITMKGEGAYCNVYSDNHYTQHFGIDKWKPTYTITKEDVARLANGNYTLTILVYEGTCESVEISGGSSDTPAATPTYALTLNASNGGTVIGAGTYDEGTTVLIKAVPNAGYEFVKWSDDNTNAVRSVTLDANVTLEATFATGEDIPVVHKQLTNVPTIYLNAETIGDEWTQAAVEVFDKDNKLYQGETWLKEGLSKKGNPIVSVQYQGSGKENSKNSYRLKFNDKTQLMASGLYKQWVLSSNDDDPSMINNALAKELGDAVGMPWTPGYQFVDLYVNDEYMGTYQLTDRVKAEAGRSLVAGGDKDFDWQVQFDDKTEIKENSNAVYIDKIEAAPKIVIKNPDPDDLTDEQIATLKEEMTTYFSAFFGNNYANVADNVEQAQLINWYICQEILGVYKGFSSVEAYRSITELATDSKVHFGPLWDSEKAFGNFGQANPIDMSDKETAGSHKGLMIDYAAHKIMKNFFNALWTQDWFKQGVIEKWNTLYGSSASTDLLATLKQKATSISSTLAQTQEKNAEKWDNSLGNYENYNSAVNAISTYLDQRFEYLNKKFNELANDNDVTLLDLINAIQKAKNGEGVTKADIEEMVRKLLGK